MKPFAVVGDSWAALGAVALLLAKNHSVVWLAGTGSKTHPVLPSLQQGAGADLWRKLAQSFEIEISPEQESEGGSLIREFKNKSFRSAEAASFKERIWTPELAFGLEGDLRFALPLIDIEALIRAKVLENPALKRIEGVPLTGIQAEGGYVKSILLGSGETLACSDIIYADRWNVLGQIEGLPKPLNFTRKRDPMGLLQIALTHDSAPQGSPTEAYFTPLTRDLGEDFERNVWGYFFQEGKQSVWTICVTQEEGEDNHLLGKKLRKMKAAVDKMFSGTEFTSNVRNERVSFQEAVLFAGGSAPVDAIGVPGFAGLSILTDAYGPSSAFEQLSFLADFQGTHTESERVDSTHSTSL